MTPLFFSATLAARHGFFTRNGGHSTGLYASLNGSFSGGDDPAAIRANRAAVAAAMGVSPENLLGLKQTHSAAAVTVTTPWPPGEAPAADALVTATPNLAFGIITADCAPVLFADTTGAIIGAAHAGWRGALAGILEATATAMRALGAATITAAIGPCIHQQNYEVGQDLQSAILARNPQDAIFFAATATPQKWLFNLPAYCAARLAAINIASEILPHDTYAEEQNFFSHRRRTHRAEPATGHQISVIRL